MTSPSLFRRFVSFLLAMLVLTASVGLSVQRQTCRMSGRSQVDVSVLGKVASPAGCEGMVVPAAPIADDNCCDFSSHLHKLTTPAQELAAKVLVPAPLLAVLPAGNVTWPLHSAEAAPEARVPRWFAADTSPPNPGGRVLLALVCKLVV